MSIKKRLALILAILMIASVLCACNKNDTNNIITTVNGPIKAGYYSFYSHWQRDYMKALLSTNGYDISSNINMNYNENTTVKDSIIATAKQNLLNFVIITNKFNEYNLNLTEEEQATIKDIFETDWISTYGEDGVKSILKTLNLTKDEFMSLLAVEAKSNAVINYLYGENGLKPITKNDKKIYFSKNYMRFKYILLPTVDNEDNPLPVEEIATKRTLANEIINQYQNGTAFEELVAKHSADYQKISDEMTNEQKEKAEKVNRDAVEDGIICNAEGVFNEDYYNYYGVSVANTILEKLKSAQIGDAMLCEEENAIWVVCKYDQNEKESYFTERETSIFQALYAEDFRTKYTRWLSELDYAFIPETLEKLDPEYYGDLFSEAYNLSDAS